jgi:hypothetical protein
MQRPAFGRPLIGKPFGRERSQMSKDQLEPAVSTPGALAIGPSSPVQRALALVRAFLATDPEPDLASSATKSCGLLAGNYLLKLLDACGLLNGQGLHSAAVTMLRPLEDALDCFAAVTIVEGAAERWAARNLRPSDAAKAWTAMVPAEMSPTNSTLADYRKTLRGQYAHYTHCSYDLCLWDLFFYPQSRDPHTGYPLGSYELNRDRRVINSNAHAIDAHLTAHLLELLLIVNFAYGRALRRQPKLMQELSQQREEAVAIMERHNQHGCQNVLAPPEWRKGNF